MNIFLNLISLTVQSLFEEFFTEYMRFLGEDFQR